jgi:hypothetical protein
MKDPEDSDSWAAPLDDDTTASSHTLTMFLGGLATLLTCVSGIGYVFWRSDQEYGGLPSPSGAGLILHGGVAIGVAIAVAFALWGYFQWIGSKRSVNRWPVPSSVVVTPKIERLTIENATDRGMALSERVNLFRPVSVVVTFQLKEEQRAPRPLFVWNEN